MGATSEITVRSGRQRWSLAGLLLAAFICCTAQAETEAGLADGSICSEAFKAGFISGRSAPNTGGEGNQMAKECQKNREKCNQGRNKCNQGRSKCWQQMKLGTARRQAARKKRTARINKVKEKREAARKKRQDALKSQQLVLDAMAAQLKACKAVAESAEAGGTELAEARGTGTQKKRAKLSLAAAKAESAKAAAAVVQAKKSAKKAEVAADEAQKAEDATEKSAEADEKADEKVDEKADEMAGEQAGDPMWRGAYNSTHADENPRSDGKVSGCQHQPQGLKRSQRRKKPQDSWGGCAGCLTQVTVNLPGRQKPVRDDVTCTSCRHVYSFIMVFHKSRTGKCNKLIISFGDRTLVCYATLSARRTPAMCRLPKPTLRPSFKCRLRSVLRSPM